MCLGIPGEVMAVEPASDELAHGLVSFGGIRKRVCLAYVPEARPGDYVIVHAGFALTVVDPDEAARVFEALDHFEPIGGPDHEVPG
jgi:hydrogenase expression/formation protein HypC